MNKYQEKINKLREFCNSLHCDLYIRYYDNCEIAFTCMTEDDEEVFTIVLFYPQPTEFQLEKMDEKTRKTYLKRRMHIRIYSDNESWKGGTFEKENIELLLSLDDLTDEELGIYKPLLKEVLKNA